jgi:hypothetical protein
LLRKLDGRRAANAAGRTGDKNYFSVKIAHGFFLLVSLA